MHLWHHNISFRSHINLFCDQLGRSYFLFIIFFFKIMTKIVYQIKKSLCHSCETKHLIWFDGRAMQLSFQHFHVARKYMQRNIQTQEDIDTPHLILSQSHNMAPSKRVADRQTLIRPACLITACIFRES